MVQTTGSGDVLVKIDGDDTGLRDAAQRSADHLSRIEERARTTSGVMDKLKGVMVGLGAVLGAQAISKYADNWSELNARVNNAAGSMEKGATVMNRLQEMARRTYSSVNQTTEAFLGQSTTMQALGFSTETQLNVTEALNNALVISATRGQRAESVMSAWSKAMALGKLSGDNLNSVIQGSDRLTQALADSMGVSVVELRKMGEEGKITAERMAGITSELDKLREEADAMPATLEDAMTLWNDALLVVIGTIDRATGSSQGLAEFLVQMADWFRNSADTAATLAVMIQNALGDAIEGITALFSPLASESDIAFAAMAAGIGIATAAAARLAVVMTTQVIGAIRAVTAAMMANPLGLFVAAVATAIAAAYLFRDKIFQAIGVDSIEVMKDFANGVVGAVKSSFEAVGVIVTNFPAMMSEVATNAANAFVAGIEWMVNKTIAGFNRIIDAANAVARFFGADWVAEHMGWGTGQIGNIGELSLGRFANEAAGTMKNVGEEINRIFTDNSAVDYVGNLKTALGEMWETAAGATEEAKALMAALDGEDDVGGGGGGGDDGDGRGGGRGGGGRGKKDRAERMREKMAARLEAIKEGLMSEEEAEIASHERLLEELRTYWENRLLTEEEYHALVEQAKQKHEDKLADIRQKAMQQEAQARSQMFGYITNTLQSISSIMDGEGDKQIRIQKAISLAIAAINVAEGITKALTLPFPANLAAAAATAAQGMAAIASIRSANRGSAGTVGGGGGSTVGPAIDAAVNKAPQSIYIQGIDRNSLYSGEAILMIMDGISEAVSNGAVIRTQPS